jgi:hypothetical protein
MWRGGLRSIIGPLGGAAAFWSVIFVGSKATEIGAQA